MCCPRGEDLFLIYVSCFVFSLVDLKKKGKCKDWEYKPIISQQDISMCLSCMCPSVYYSSSFVIGISIMRLILSYSPGQWQIQRGF